MLLMAALNKAELKHLLQKEANGNLTPAERQQLDDWYQSFDADQKDLVVFRDGEHEEQVRQRLLNRILEAEEDLDLPQHTHKYRSLVTWFSAAAAILLITGFAVLWKLRSNPANVKQIFLSCISGQGQLKQITLEDGTQIWLNAGSQLRYPDHFNRDREVYLSGEAYFDVKHDPSRPFIVHSGSLTTSVLGTAFSVTAYGDAPEQAVIVSRGKVQVANDKKVLGFLTPNNRIEYYPKSGKYTATSVDAAAMMAWKDGKLQFENQNMWDIASRLGRWYGYSFKFEHHALSNCRYTASFDNKIPLSDLLKVMKAISLVGYKIDANSKTITFLGTGCNE
jgi:transmembrane sensor